MLIYTFTILLDFVIEILSQPLSLGISEYEEYQKSENVTFCAFVNCLLATLS